MQKKKKFYIYKILSGFLFRMKEVYGEGFGGGNIGCRKLIFRRLSDKVKPRFLHSFIYEREREILIKPEVEKRGGWGKEKNGVK